MTIAEYRQAGYNVSATIAQSVIDRAEADVKTSYIAPITDASVDSDADVRNAVMCLSYLLVTQRKTFATNAGGRIKQNQFSETPTEGVTIGELGQTCDLYLQTLRKKEGSRANAEIKDICRIYFVTNYIHS